MRYNGEPKRLYDFMSEFAVHCPVCNERATVYVPYFLHFMEARLKCNSCHFSEKIESRIQYKLSGRAKCIHCLEFLDLSKINPYKEIPKFVNVKCGSCLRINKVNKNWNAEVVKYQNTGVTDPAFGLPLWYKTEIKGNIFWAYNLEHLIEIRDYVEARLRERSTHRFKMTMVEKLPDFLKAAKNRKLVLKHIAKMIIS